MARCNWRGRGFTHVVSISFVHGNQELKISFVENIELTVNLLRDKDRGLSPKGLGHLSY